MKSIEKIIERQLRQWESERRRREEEAARDTVEEAPIALGKPVITISRETGAGGNSLANVLAGKLGYQVFDRQIVDHITAQSGIRQRMVESLDERSQSELDLWVEGLVHQRYVNASDYLKSLIPIIGSVAELGEIIIVGRGANFILGPARGIHVRVVAPLDVRVGHMTTLLSYSAEDARRYIEKTDENRRAFIRAHYDSEWSDPSAYHMVINSAAVGFDAAANAVLKLVERWPDLQ
jgi:cytidylate kinase